MKAVRLCIAFLLLSCPPAFAQSAADYPARPIRVVVPYAAGGADAYIRPLQNALEKNHRINFVIESVVGAGGVIGASQVKRSASDGYTLLFCGTGAMTIAPKMSKADYTMADFDPIINLISIPYVVAVRKEAPYRTFKEFAAYAKANPGKVTYGSPGVGSAPHLAMEALDLGVTHVPYTGIVPAVTAIVGGHIDAVVGAPNIVLPQVRSGNLVALGVTSRQRFALEPELPSLSEQGFDVDVVTSFGFLAPKGTPRPIIDRLAAAIRQSASDPEFLTAMKTMQNGVVMMSADEFATKLKAEADYFSPVIEKLAKR